MGSPGRCRWPVSAVVSLSCYTCQIVCYSAYTLEKAMAENPPSKGARGCNRSRFFHERGRGGGTRLPIPYPYLSIPIPIPIPRLLYLLTLQSFLLLLSFRRKEESVNLPTAGSSAAGTGGEACWPICSCRFPPLPPFLVLRKAASALALDWRPVGREIPPFIGMTTLPVKIRAEDSPPRRGRGRLVSSRR